MSPYLTGGKAKPSGNNDLLISFLLLNSCMNLFLILSNLLSDLSKHKNKTNAVKNVKFILIGFDLDKFHIQRGIYI